MNLGLYNAGSRVVHRMKSLFGIELLEYRHCLTSVVFIEHVLEQSSSGNSPLPDANDILAADIDGDTDMDIVAVFISSGSVAWYENIDGQGRFGDHRIIGTMAPGATLAIQSSDIDSDGDLDIVAAAYNSELISWYENLDGRGNFGEANSVGAVRHGQKRLFNLDVDNDKDVDVLIAYRDGVSWFENRDGSGQFGTSQQIVTKQGCSFNVGNVVVSDINADSSHEVMAVMCSDLVKIQYESGMYGDAEIAFRDIQSDRNTVHGIFIEDIDGDGDKDLLTNSGNGDYELRMYKNESGTGDFQRSSAILASGVECLETGDFDQDGDVDVIACAAGDVVWFGWNSVEQTLDLPHFAGTLFHSPALVVEDIDGDGDFDAVVGSGYWFSGKVAWYEHRIVGDSNDDGIFDSSDLVRVLQAGEYEDAVDSNSTFDEGDWNGDGDFDSTDFIFAFQAGAYRNFAMPKTVAVVESIFQENENLNRILRFNIENNESDSTAD